MVRLLLPLFFILLINVLHAQTRLCLQKDPLTGHIDFQADELNRMLQLDQHRFIFFGEQHNAVFDPEIKYHLITDLYRRSGIRHVFMEISVSGAWHCNQYLQTGDTSHLHLPANPSANNGYTIFWKRLYAFNKSLNEGAKIIIHGTDFEGTGVFPTLKQLAPSNGAIPLSLRPVMDTVNAHLLDKPLHMWEVIDNKFILYDNSAFTKTLRYVQAQLLDHDADVRAYFGHNYTVVHSIANNSARVEVKPGKRNKTMFAAIEQAIEQEGVDKFVGFFGSQHTNNSIHNSVPNAVKRMKGITAKDILTIAEFAYDTRSKITAFRSKHFQEIVDMNKGCRASVYPANVVPGFKGESDFVIAADVGE